MRRTALLLALVIGATFASGQAVAEPYEFYGCSFLDGKDMSDMDAWTAQWKAKMKTFENQTYTAVILTPQYTGAAEVPDFFWMGAWPDAKIMGASNHEFFESGKGAGLIDSLNKIVRCTASQWWGKTVYTAP